MMLIRSRLIIEVLILTGEKLVKRAASCRMVCCTDQTSGKQIHSVAREDFDWLKTTLSTDAKPCWIAWRTKSRDWRSRDSLRMCDVIAR